MGVAVVVVASVGIVLPLEAEPFVVLGTTGPVEAVGVSVVVFSFVDLSDAAEGWCCSRHNQWRRHHHDPLLGIHWWCEHFRMWLLSFQCIVSGLASFSDECHFPLLASSVEMAWSKLAPMAT